MPLICCTPTPSMRVGGPFAHALFTGTALGALFRTTTLSIGTALSTAIPSLVAPLSGLALSCKSTYAVLGLAGTIAAFFKWDEGAFLLILIIIILLLLLIHNFYTTTSLPWFPPAYLSTHAPTCHLFNELDAEVTHLHSLNFFELRRSPLTACALVLELTEQMDHLLPLLATTGTAALTSHLLAALKDEKKKKKKDELDQATRIVVLWVLEGLGSDLGGGGGAQMPWGLKPYKWPLQVSKKLESSSFFYFAFFFVHFSSSAHTRFFHSYFHFH